MNLPEASKPKVLAMLGSLDSATVSPLAKEGWFAVDVVIPEKMVRVLVPELIRAGAKGIVEYSLNKVTIGDEKLN